MKYSNLSLVRDERVDDNRNRLYVSWALSCVLNVVPSSIIGIGLRWHRSQLISYRQQRFTPRTSTVNSPHSSVFHLNRIMESMFTIVTCGETSLVLGLRLVYSHLKCVWMHVYQCYSVIGIMWSCPMNSR